MAKKIILLLLCLTFVLPLVSCGEDVDVNEELTYDLNGITVVLPRYMRRSYSEDWDFYFDNLSMAMYGKCIDRDVLADMELPATTTRKEYADLFIENRKLDKTKIELTEDAGRATTTFRYIYQPEDGSAAQSCQVVLIGDTGNLWFVEISADSETFDEHVSMFKVWCSKLTLTERKPEDEPK